jgi:uncharacterized protein involved in exopolysaccharide biosynthesis
MNETTPAPPAPAPPGLFDFGGLLARIGARWRRHLVNVLLAGIVMYGVTWLMPSWYQSTAVILPPEENEQGGSIFTMQRFLSRVPSISALSNYYTPADVYRAILASRSVQQAMVERFDLQRVYHQRSMEKTLKELRSHVRIALAPNGTISVAVEDRSRERAAQIANAMIEELDRFNVERRNFQAKRTRQFLERRVAETDSLSRAAEAALRAYQERHHVVAPAEVEGATVGPLADLMANRLNLEVQLSVLRSYLREDNERVIQLRTQLAELNRSIAALPALQTELGRLLRDVRLYQQTYVLLSAQLEDARLRETMDTPTVTVLDSAVPSERRVKPIRALWAGAAMVLAGLVSFLVAERKGAAGSGGKPATA